MKKKIVCLLGLMIAGQASAYDGMTSQIPHAMGGAILAGVVSKAFEQSEHRAWIGFGVSTALVVAVEGSRLGTGDRRHSQLLDIAYHTLGAAVGAWVTDKYILAPVVTPNSVGLVYKQNF